MKKAVNKRLSGVMKRKKNAITKRIAAKGTPFQSPHLRGTRLYAQDEKGQIVRVA